MVRPTHEFALQQLTKWQVALAELSFMEACLSQDMREYARTLAEPPRQQIIEVERKRASVAQLFEAAIEALGSCSPTPTGHTNFGGLN